MIEPDVLPPVVWTVEIVTARTTIFVDFERKGDAERLANQITSIPADTFLRVPAQRVRSDERAAEILWVRPGSVCAVRVSSNA